MPHPRSPPYIAKEKPTMASELQLPSLSELFPREDPSPPYTPDYPYLSAQSSPGKSGSARSYDVSDSPPSIRKRFKTEQIVECSGAYAVGRPVLSPHVFNLHSATGFSGSTVRPSLGQPYLPPLRTAAPLPGQEIPYWSPDGITQVQDAFDNYASQQQQRQATGNQSYQTHSALEPMSPFAHPSHGSFRGSINVDDSFYSYARRDHDQPETLGCEACSRYGSSHQPPNIRCHAESPVDALLDRGRLCYPSSQPSTKYDLSTSSRRTPYDVPSKGVCGAHKSHTGRDPAGYSSSADYDGTHSRVSFATSGVSSDSGKGRRRGNLPKEATSYLKEWFAAHTAHPYPSEEEKARFAADTGLSPAQIGNWFINARRRHLPGLLNDQAQDKARRPILNPYRSNHY